MFCPFLDRLGVDLCSLDTVYFEGPKGPNANMHSCFIHAIIGVMMRRRCPPLSCVFMGTHEYSLVLMGTHGYPWIPMDTRAYPWVPDGYPRLPLGTHGFPWALMVSHGVPMGTPPHILRASNIKTVETKNSLPSVIMCFGPCYELSLLVVRVFRSFGVA